MTGYWTILNAHATSKKPLLYCKQKDEVKNYLQQSSYYGSILGERLVILELPVIQKETRLQRLQYGSSSKRL